MDGLATNVTVSFSQTISPGTATMLTLAGWLMLTFMATTFDDAVVPIVQVAFDIMLQVTTSPLASVLLLKVALFGPVSMPFTYHSKIGAGPALLAVAVKVTGVPAQMVVASATMLTLTGKIGFTFMTTLFDVAGLPVAQVAFDRSVQVTTSLLAKAALVNVGLLKPADIPFTNHAYTGLFPPLTGVATNVTVVPAQIAPGGTPAILTLTGIFVFTAIVRAFDAAGLPDTHDSLEVITQVTTSLLAMIEEE